LTLARHAPNARLLAGGTDLLVDLKAGRVKIDHLVSINRVRALHGVAVTRSALRISALTTVTQLDRAQVVREQFRPILDATAQMAVPQIRNVATVGGNICSAVPCADLPPILTAMNASVVLWSPKGQRNVPLQTFFTGVRETALHEDEVLAAILVPALPSAFGAAYARFGLRNGNAVAVASVAAGLTLGSDNTVRDARIVLGAVAPIPKLAKSAGAGLIGQPADEDALRSAANAAREEAEPISDVRSSADYRRELVGVLAYRALIGARHRAKETQ
jgi:carbon-monoxide dehydrogenase medium subunit